MKATPAQLKADHRWYSRHHKKARVSNDKSAVKRFINKEADYSQLIHVKKLTDRALQLKCPINDSLTDIK